MAGSHPTVAHLRWIHDDLRRMVLMMLRRHGLRVALGETMMGIVTSFVYDAVRSWMLLQRVPILLRLCILVVAGRVVAVAGLALLCYMAPIFVVFHMVSDV